MTSIVLKRLTMLLPVFAALAIVTGRPVSVLADCGGELGACYQNAANNGSVWGSWAAGLDCEVAYAACVLTQLESY